METACLRIKFTPLFQQQHQDNSKCFLEIVPEVSCIQNFDKIEWKEENNLIEYIIPMTYKIILKKRQNIRDTSDDLLKTYHSCVDLPLPSSIANFSLASGDIGRITSDTLILTKFTTQFPSLIINSKEHINLTKDHKSSVDTNSYTVINKMTNTSLDMARELSDQNFEKTEDIPEFDLKADDEIVELDLQNNHNIVDKILLDKNMGTESVCLYTHIAEQIPQVFKTSKPDFKCRLSLTPICSISTEKYGGESKIATSRAIICKIYESQKGFVPLESISSPSPSDIYNDNPTTHSYSQTTQNESCNSFEFRASTRILPEIRIAGYMQMIEKEILPLKITLNEIMQKCTLLGVTKHKTAHQRTVISTPASNSNELKTIEGRKKSNRVVYSIMFDE